MKKLLLLVVVVFLCSCAINKPDFNNISKPQKEVFSELEEDETLVLKLDDAKALLPVFDSLIRVNYENHLEYNADNPEFVWKYLYNAITNWSYMLPLSETDNGETEELHTGIVEVKNDILSKTYKTGFGTEKSDFSDMPYDITQKVGRNGEKYLMTVSDMNGNYSEIKSISANDVKNTVVRVYYCTESDMILAIYDFELIVNGNDYSVISMNKSER